MGGRGASGGVSASGKPYGSEYRTVLAAGRIKFVEANDGSNKAPLETMTRGRIYATVAKGTKALKAITYYDRDNKRFKQIDLDHYHKVGGKPTRPHTQTGYYHDGTAAALSTDEKKLLDKVKRLWQNRHSK